MFRVCVGRGGLPSVMLVSSGRLLCLCTAGMRARCSDSFTRNTGVACLSLYHFDWNTPSLAASLVGRLPLLVNAPFLILAFLIRALPS